MKDDEFDYTPQMLRELLEEHEQDQRDLKAEEGRVTEPDGSPGHPASTEAQAPQAKRVPGVPFPKGRSGNPSGRPKGARGLKTLRAELLIDVNIDRVTTKGLTLALNGNVALIKYFLGLTVGRPDPAAICIDIPPLTSQMACRDAIGIIAEDAAAGKITFDEADRVVALVEKRIKSLPISEPDGQSARQDAINVYYRLAQKYPAGVSEEDDERQLGLFFEELCACNLKPHQEKRLFDDYKEHVRLRRTRWERFEEEKDDQSTGSDKKETLVRPCLSGGAGDEATDPN